MSVTSNVEFWEGAEGIDTATYSDEDANILNDYVTNIDRNIFGWKIYGAFMPEQAGALLSRYSRTSFTGRELFLKEFYPNKNRGREFFESWLVDYGDDSIQEMAGGIPASCEFISNVAAKHLEDNRFGSFIEKSTRYVSFDKKLSNGEYMYYKDREIMDSRYADEYVQLMRGLFDSYVNHTEEMASYLKEVNPFEEQKFRIGSAVVKPTELSNNMEEEYGLSGADLEKAYGNAIKANALDFMRDYLPMSTLTHVGINANARVYEGMINKMLASPLGECRWIANRLHGELSKMVPSLVKRTKEKHGMEHQEYLSNSERNTIAAIKDAKIIGPEPRKRGSGGKVDILDYTGKDTLNSDKVAVATACADLLFTNDAAESYDAAYKTAMTNDEKINEGILSAYIGNRGNRRHRPGRALEGIRYKLGFTGRIGIYRDIQRHRVGTQRRTEFTTNFGYNIRKEYETIGIADDYHAKMARVIELHDKIKEKIGAQAQYVVTFGFDIKWTYELNARQMFHMLELRSAPGGHPDYRALMQDAYVKLQGIHPSIAKHMKFMDMSHTVLGRLNSEIRIAQKKNALQGRS